MPRYVRLFHFASDSNRGKENTEPAGHRTRAREGTSHGAEETPR